MYHINNNISVNIQNKQLNYSSNIVHYKNTFYNLSY